MTWKDVVIAILIVVCCLLVFKNNDSMDNINIIEIQNDSLLSIDQVHMDDIKHYKGKLDKQKTEFYTMLTKVNKDHATQIRKQNRYVRRMDIRINSMDSSSSFGLLSDWLIRETGESLIKSN